MSLGLKLGFVGAGQMARAIGVSLIEKGLLLPTQVTVSSPEASHLDVWKGIGCNTTFENEEVVSLSNAIMWAVKPQYFESALKEIKPNREQNKNKFHISIMAGVPLSKFSGLLNNQISSSAEKLRAARVMPNIAMQVGAGVSVYTLGPNCTSSDSDNLQKVLSNLGLTYQVPEQQINAYCGLFASGIGFMFPILEALSDGGVKMGIPRDISIMMAAQVMKGAGSLVLEEKAHPGVLKDRVCSAGGTTIAGVSAMEAGGVRNSIIQAIEAATKRGEELDKLSN